jgi:glycosyltransferase involved in cell wall biosynthesis
LDSVVENAKAERPHGGLQVEHLVVDGASTDGTVEILENWKAESRKKRIESYTFDYLSEPDAGMSDAINKGARRAKGDWWMWLNTDDYLLPGALEKVARFIQHHPEADVVYGDCHFVREDKSLIRKKVTGKFDLLTLLFYGCYIQSTSCFYRRSLVDEGLLLDVEKKVCMDFDYYMKLALSGKHFAYIREWVAAFRWHGTNMSATQTEQRKKERLEVQKEALKVLGYPCIGSVLTLKILFYMARIKRQLFLLCH